MISKFIGVAKLNRKLARLPGVARNEMRQALAQSAREITNLMEALVPQDTGALAGSIGWTWGEAPKGSLAIGFVKSGEMTITIYCGDADAYYARWVEFGTRKLSAQPFFYPAYRALRKRSASRIKRSARRAAKKVAAA
ncbi:HK97-gp10 family putative phage morphogenesis protein [Tianweitania sediminis]|uniref:HK97 gp10 family phage protein n=1 Tax=Tianweitania sediminis TaxID=1502156 RepID=A0A8J7R7K1_9HYPH|nr:HK97 gp10 family phage protein [Tianweitania sediminis]